MVVLIYILKVVMMGMREIYDDMFGIDTGDESVVKFYWLFFNPPNLT